MASEFTLPEVDKRPSILARAQASTITDEPVDLAREIIKKKWWFKLFVLVSSLFAVGEVILIGWSPKNFTPFVGFEFKFQLYVHIVSTVLFGIGVLITAKAMDLIPPEELKEPLSSFADNIFQSFDVEISVEFFSLLLGWLTIFYAPGLATLRCLRLFRYFWYFELFSSKKGSHPYRMLVKSSQLVIGFLEKIGAELFSTESRGGIVVLAMFFFVSYVFAVVYHTSLGDLNTNEGLSCGILSNCFIVMLRLVFYDGNGFDYMNAMVLQGYRGWAFLIIVYMCFSAMILLNGLIGIFGIAFQDDSEEEEEEEEEDEGKDGEKKVKKLPKVPDGPLADVQALLQDLEAELKALKREIVEIRLIEELKKPAKKL